MELFGLRDERGQEYRINTCDLRLHGNITFEPVNPKPEFKVGDWVCAKEDSSQLERIEGLQQDAFIVSNGSGIYLNLSRDWRHATRQEIESHLRKICDEKGYKKDVKVRCLVFPGRDICTLSGEYKYVPEEDRLIGITVNSWHNAVVYEQGKFAEIVPDKKPLPKTKEELRTFLNAFADRNQGDFEDFLSNYED